MGRLDGKVAIISGASSGMGEAAAIIFAKEGAKVALMARREDKLMKVCSRIEKDGGVVLPFVADISKEEDWDRVIAGTVAKFNTVDILINNAGIAGDGKTTSFGESFELKGWQKIINNNLYGTIFGIQKTLSIMKKNGGGSIVNVSSIAAVDSVEGGSAYTATKGAISALTRGLQREVGEYNIRVNTVIPGIIRTEMTPFTNDKNDPKCLRCLPKIKLPMLIGEADDIAYAMLYLASDESRYVTGTEIIVDGGYVVN